MLPISETYSTIKEWANNSKLVPGQQYLITDFQTLHIIPNTTDRNDTNVEIPVEPIILTAISTSEFDGRVVSTVYPQDTIEYTIDNTAWGALVTDESKGKIIRRIDNDLKIDVCQDFRNCIFRRWNVDLTAYTGVAENYVLWNTSVNIGKPYNVAAWNVNFVASDSEDYQDFRMFNNFENNNSIFINCDDEILSNCVFTKQVDGLTLYKGSTFHSNRRIAHSKATYSKNNLIVRTSYTEDREIAFNAYNFEINFISCGVWGSDCGVFGNTRGCSFYPSDTGKGFNDILAFSKFGTIIGACVRFTSTETLWYRPTAVQLETYGYYTQVSLDIFGNQTKHNQFEHKKLQSIYNSGGLSLVSINITGLTKPCILTENYSNLEYIYELTSSIIGRSTTLYSELCGIYKLTQSGGGTRTITAITNIAGQRNTNRVPLTLQPQSGLTITIANSDITDGILTNGQTFEANGTLKETIKLEWDITLQRFIVTSGRTI